METYKFETMIQENGVIQIPEMAPLAHRRVEIFVVVSPVARQVSKQSQTLGAFLSKWRGFLQGFNLDELKLGYLQEKYG